MPLFNSVQEGQDGGTEHDFTFDHEDGQDSSENDYSGIQLHF